MKVSRIISGLAVIVVAATTASLPVLAETANYGGGSVAAYAATESIDNGRIVQLDGSSKKVKVATDLQNMFGVTVDRRELPVTLSQDGQENAVYVAVSGIYNVIVSTQGGTIAPNDYVTLSSVNGVAMKASADQKTVFGRAVSGFDGKGVTLGTTTLKDTTGKDSKTVTLGSIPVAITIMHNPEDKSTKANLPDVLQRVGAAIAEKDVSPIRIYLSIGIAVIAVIAAIVVLYSGVRNSMISIGRNPMSKKSIFRGLLEVILTSIVILIIGLFAVYLLLKL